MFSLVGDVETLGTLEQQTCRVSCGSVIEYAVDFYSC